MLLAIMRKSVMLLLAVIGFTAFAAAQTVTGTVTDAKGEPVSGISVTVKGTTKGTATNAQGVFTLNGVANGATLVFTGSGFTSQEAKVTGGTVNASMVASVSSLNEVVVVGYGSVRKKDLTGAVGTVSAKNFNQGAISTPDQLLQSKLAGVLVTTNSGEPGSGTTVTIRGNNSMRANNNPLYVIDDVPFDGRSAEPGVNVTGPGSTPSPNPLLFLNPNDIASLTILKDASASAIFGSRGANGVIQIVTKKGNSGSMKLDVSTDFGFFGGYMKKFDILSSTEFVQALNKYYPGNATYAALNFGGSVDALKAITSNATSKSYNLALSGGNENGKFRASFYANNTEGFLKGTGLQKYIGSFAGSTSVLNKKIIIDFNLTVANIPHKFGAKGNTPGSTGDIMAAALAWNPTQNFRDAAGLYTFNKAPLGNPLAWVDAVNDKSITNTLFSNISGTYKITDHLSYKLLYAVNNSTGERKTNYAGWLGGGLTGISGTGLGILSNAKVTSQTITHTLNYDVDLTKKLHLTALGGYEYFKSDYNSHSNSASGFNTNLTQTTIIPILYTSIMQNAATQLAPTSYVEPTTEIQSLFARGIFSLNDKYIITATVRRDGSSKFGANNKYAIFPSIAGKWNLNNEGFMKNNKTFSNLAVRASWGITGNQEYPAGSAEEQFNFGAYNSAGQINVANPDLKWEETTATNFGIDFGFLQGRIFGSIDLYNKNTTNLLYSATAIQPAPATQYWKNIDANLINKGFELQIGGTVLQKTHLGWDLSFNYSNNSNKLTNYKQANIPTGVLNGAGTSDTRSQIIANNYPLQEFYLKHFTGFDANGNQQISDNPTFAGDPNAHYYLGLSSVLRYDKLTLTLNAGGAGGNMIFNNTASSITDLAAIANGNNIDKTAYNTQEKPSSTVAPSDRFLEKGDFIKLRNASLSYNFGNIRNIFKDVTAYVSGNNLFVITKFRGFDPEVNIDKSYNGYVSRSIEYAPYPTARTFQLGFKFTLQ